MDRILVQRPIRITLGLCLISILSEARYIENADVFTKTIRMPNVQPEKVSNWKSNIYNSKENFVWWWITFSLVTMFSLQTDFIIFSSFEIKRSCVTFLNYDFSQPWHSRGISRAFLSIHDKNDR